MSNTIIRVENLGKKYVIGHQKQERYTALRDVIANGAKSVGRKLLKPLGKGNSDPTVEEFWALKDVSFEIQQGDRVGIIGRNGAGKSTLLKILSRITEPTTGSIRIKGRVASLLEVGTGFHPELTGRENIYLNGAILGMSKAEIKRKFDEIVAFAEVEKFLDTPVKRYSSGMYVRLAFAVAAHLEPEILVVDEVLAVGDVQFQKKCLGKMQQVGEDGKTVLFVSHSMHAIASLTQKCLVLSQGECIYQGNTSGGITKYLSENQHDTLIYRAISSYTKAQITQVELVTSQAENVQHHGDSMEVQLTINVPHGISGARIALKICDSLQQPILYIWCYDSESPILREPGTYLLVCHIPRIHLYIGKYSLTLILAEQYGGKHIEKIDKICPFELIMHENYREGGWLADEGKYIEDFTWSIKTIK